MSDELLLAVLSVAAVVLNAVTTGEHLVKTLFTETYWPVAGVDLSLLVTAAIALWAARKLAMRGRPSESAPAANPSTAAADTAPA